MSHTTTTDTTIQSVVYFLDRISRQQSVIIEDIREARRWTEEAIADSKLEHDKQLRSLGAAVAAVRGELAELNRNLQVIIRSVHAV